MKVKVKKIFGSELFHHGLTFPGVGVIIIIHSVSAVRKTAWERNVSRQEQISFPYLFRYLELE